MTFNMLRIWIVTTMYGSICCYVWKCCWNFEGYEDEYDLCLDIEYDESLNYCYAWIHLPLHLEVLAKLFKLRVWIWSMFWCWTCLRLPIRNINGSICHYILKCCWILVAASMNMIYVSTINVMRLWIMNMNGSIYRFIWKCSRNFGSCESEYDLCFNDKCDEALNY